MPFVLYGILIDLIPPLLLWDSVTPILQMRKLNLQEGIELTQLLSDRAKSQMYNLPYVSPLHCLIKLETNLIWFRGGRKGVFSGMKERPKNHEMDLL